MTIQNVFRILLTGLLASFAYVIWFLIGSAELGVHTIQGFRGALVFFTGLMIAFVWFSQEQ